MAMVGSNKTVSPTPSIALKNAISPPVAVAVDKNGDNPEWGGALIKGGGGSGDGLSGSWKSRKTPCKETSRLVSMSFQRRWNRFRDMACETNHF
jgi:hypothetical protein